MRTSAFLFLLCSVVGTWAVPVADAGALSLAEADPGAIANPDPEPEAALAPFPVASAWPYLGARLSASPFPDDGGDGSDSSEEDASGGGSSGKMKNMMDGVKLLLKLMLDPILSILALVGISL
uniref:Uncharacterized protein n=1 Tax=Homalodisca liturata TaxID=320908 RepID=A0A1B6IKX5_9HEMI